MATKFNFTIGVGEGAKILVGVGDKVSAGNVVAKTQRVKQVEVSAAENLGIPPGDLRNFLKVAVGQAVAPQDVLAVRSSFMKKIEVRAPVGGSVSRIEEGKLWITSGEKYEEQIKTPVSGKVAEADQVKVKIEVAGKFFEGKKAWGPNAMGILKAVGEWGTVKLDQITSGEKGQIVVTADTIPPVWLVKAQALEVSGVVCAGLKDEAETEVPEGLSVIIMGEDGHGQMAKSLWEDLSQLAGKVAVVRPKEKILGIIS